MTVYRRPDPIPRRRPDPVVQSPGLTAVRNEPDDLHHLVARKIHAAITAGHFPEGSILPTEHALGQSLGVSRTALREAIKGLSSKGMLETRRRRGTMIVDRSHWTQVDREVIAWSRKQDAGRISAELWQSVAAVMPALAEAAAGNAGRARGLTVPDPVTGQAGLQAMSDYFNAIARMSDNRFLSSVASICLASLVQDDPEFLTRVMEGLDRPRLAGMHAAVLRGDRAAAADLMRRLLDDATPVGASPATAHRSPLPA